MLAHASSGGSLPHCPCQALPDALQGEGGSGWGRGVGRGVGVEEEEDGEETHEGKKGKGEIMREDRDWGRGDGVVRHTRKEKVKGATVRLLKGNEPRAKKATKKQRQEQQS